VDGYDEVHGGYGFGVRNVGGERVLEFYYALLFYDAMAVTNTWFKKDTNKLVTCVSGKDRNVIDYLLRRRCNRGAVENVMLFAGEDCFTAPAACG